MGPYGNASFCLPYIVFADASLPITFFNAKLDATVSQPSHNFTTLGLPDEVQPWFHPASSLLLLMNSIFFVLVLPLIAFADNHQENIYNLFKGLLNMEEKKILLLGLDSAGKTTILYKMKLGETVPSIPTLGYNVETVEYKNISLKLWDGGGLRSIRPLWRHYLKDYNQGLIFVVDSNDSERIGEATEELMKLLATDELRDALLLVFANKQDLPNAMKDLEIADRLGLHSLKNCNWYIQATCATSGYGLFQGLDWLLNNLKKQEVTAES